MSRRELVALGAFVLLAGLPFAVRHDPDAAPEPSAASGNATPAEPVLHPAPVLDPEPVPARPSEPEPPAPVISAVPVPRDHVGAAAPASTSGETLAQLEVRLQTASSASERMAALDAALPGLGRDERTHLLLRLLETSPGAPGEDEALRPTLIAGLGQVADDPEVSRRFVAFLEPVRPRAERLAALAALAGAPSLTPELRSVLAALAQGDADAGLETRARAILDAAGPGPEPTFTPDPPPTR